MAEIESVIGTLDDNELEFSHSGGTTYAATASIDSSETDHVAVVTATDSAGNSATETMVVAISGSWSTPKTDWYGYTDVDGIYHGDRFNSEDFNRIKNNLAYLREISVTMYKEFSINDLGEDRSKEKYFYADEINQLEENVKIIAENTFSPGVESKDNDCVCKKRSRFRWVSPLELYKENPQGSNAAYEAPYEEFCRRNHN